jgi:hypothetical protein
MPKLALPSLSRLWLHEYSSLKSPGEADKILSESEYERNILQWDGDTAIISIDYDKCLDFILIGANQNSRTLYKKKDIFNTPEHPITRKDIIDERELCTSWQGECKKSQTAVIKFSHHASAFKTVLYEAYAGATQDGRGDKRKYDSESFKKSKSIDHIVSVQRLRATQKLLQYDDVLDDPCNKIPVTDNPKKGNKIRVGPSLSWTVGSSRNYYLDETSTASFLTMCNKAVFYMFVTYPLICLTSGHFFNSRGGEQENMPYYVQYVIESAKQVVPPCYNDVYRRILSKYGRSNPLIDPDLTEGQMTALVEKYEVLFKKRYAGIDLTSSAVLGYVSDRQLKLV